MKVIFHYSYPISVDIDTDKQVDIYIDQVPVGDVPEGAIRIVMLEEPKKGLLFNYVQQNQDSYTHLLTFHEELLTTIPKAIRFHNLNTWVKGYISPQKNFSVSTVVGGKRDVVMEGYALRHNLWKNKDRITIPKRFYLSGTAKNAHVFRPWRGAVYRGQLVLGASKTPMFDSMFHIAIENTSIKHYFSEKVLDCFHTKTVPIYYGCKNIEEFFNPAGMFRVSGVEEIVQVCNQLTPEVYERMLPVVEENYELSHQYCDHEQQIKDIIVKIIS